VVAAAAAPGVKVTIFDGHRDLPLGRRPTAAVTDTLEGGVSDPENCSTIQPTTA